MAAAAFGALALLLFSWLYHGACVAACIAWRRRERGRGRKPGESDPLVSVLVPMRGVDCGLEGLLTSLLRQDYREYEVIVGALDPDDPALGLAQGLKRSELGGRLKIASGGEAFGPNRKVCNLARMAEEASGALLVLCDSDMQVTSSYLREVLLPFQDPKIGLVTCVYRGYAARNLTARLEALAIGTDFVPGAVLAAWPSGPRFAMGATIALRRELLEQIGGFAAIAEYLADDYMLGCLAGRCGWRTALSGYVVDALLGREKFGAMWARRVRWARTMRAMQPLGWIGAVVTHALPLSLAAGALVGGGYGLALVASTLLMRGLFAACYAAYGTHDREVLRSLWILPAADLLNFVVWCASFTGRTVTWRGERFRIERGGKLSAL